MSRYRKIDTRIWNDEKFRGLSDSGKLAFLFLLTHPHMTSLGAMRATIHGLAAEIGWSFERLSKGFLEGFRKGMVEHDEKACFIGLPNFLKYNPPENPNVVKSWASALDLIPECELKNILIERVRGYSEGLSEPFRKAFESLSLTLREPFRIPEQEQEQEQDIPPNPRKSKNGGDELFDLFWKAYPRHIAKPAALKSWPKIKAEEVPLILAALEWQSKQPDWLKDGGKFIPHPATWLNNKRWEDEPTASVATRVSRVATQEDIENWVP